jgi:hypothetical protein
LKNKIRWLYSKPLVGVKVLSEFWFKISVKKDKGQKSVEIEDEIINIVITWLGERRSLTS